MRQRSSTVLAELVEGWGLEVGEPFAGDRLCLVVPATDRHGRSLVLKIHPDPQWAHFEHAALAHWDGHGCVRAVAFDGELGAILMERAVPGDRLRDSSMADGDATEVFTEVAARLREAGPAEPGLPHLTSWLTLLAGCQPVAGLPEFDRHVAVAQMQAGELLAKASPFTVLHGDLHHSNIVRLGSSWIAVDPKGTLGPPEAEPAAFLKNPRSRLLAVPDPVPVLTSRCASISTRLGYDPARVASWGYVSCVLSAAWAQEDGEPVEQMRLWLRIASALEEVCRELA